MGNVRAFAPAGVVMETADKTTAKKSTNQNERLNNEDYEANV
jgi:hypothetical protein